LVAVGRRVVLVVMDCRINTGGKLIVREVKYQLILFIILIANSASCQNVKIMLESACSRVL
jgi:hypothetical protein